MQFVYTIVGVLFGLALLAALGVSIYVALAWIVGLFASLDPEIAAVTGIFSVLVILVAMIVAGGARRAVRQAMASQHQAEKTAAYRLVIEFWAGRIGDGSDAQGQDTNATADALRTLDLQISLYARPPVLRAHRRLRELLEAGRLNSDEGREALVSALVEVRGELGSSTGRPTKQDLHRILFPNENARQTEPIEGIDSIPASASQPERGGTS